MANKGETIWVGIRLGGIPRSGDVLARTNLKGLCEASGVSYSTGKSKAGGSRSGIDVFEIRDADGALWGFYRLELGRVEGRGGKREGFEGYFLG